MCIRDSRYRESQEDRSLRSWFGSDVSCGILHSITLKEGSLRGLCPFVLRFTYPITAIAGRNGAGKSTLLALACCAFHAPQSGYKLPGRKEAYYTFSDFFIQHTNEIPPSGIDILYEIAHNNWAKSERLPTGIGRAHQRRWKAKAGKWNNYDSRVLREVVFLGIGRIVPPSELSASRTYSKSFQVGKKKGWEHEVRDIVGAILGKAYDDLDFLEYSKYTLPVVKSAGHSYSGFNMGAGESALFEIFRVIFSCGKGALLVIDEIELGLHVDAQRKFIRKLKEICLKRKVQVICTTHSKEVFECLPPDGRKYLEKVKTSTLLTDGISPDFAMSKMGSSDTKELTILVEDGMAQDIISHSLPTELRQRVKIVAVGSSSALARQLAAAYARDEDRKILAIFDGDQRQQESVNFKHAKEMAELVESDFEKWLADRVTYLPGTEWPEAWLAENSKLAIEGLAERLSLEPDVLEGILDAGLQAGKHNEFYEIASSLALEKRQCIQHCVSALKSRRPELFEEVCSKVKARLDAAE